MFFKFKPNDYTQLSIALAGVFQCAILIHQLASYGVCDEEQFKNAIETIFVMDAPDVSSVFGSYQNMYPGLWEIVKTFQKNYSGKQKIIPQISQYVFSTTLMQYKLAKEKNKLDLLGRRIKQITSQAQYFSSTHQQVIANLAELYLQVMGSYKLNVQVIGKAQFLENKKILEKIRALFLAAIRSAFLWQQLGGRRWHLLFCRRAYINAINLLIKEGK